MADVFLSYARDSAASAREFASRLRDAGFSVWFDDELPAHRAYADVIAAELDEAAAVLVLWSEQAIQSQWVRSEADRARASAKLVQTRLDAARLPMPFDQIQCSDLRTGLASSDSGWRSITHAIQALVDGEEVGLSAGASNSGRSELSSVHAPANNLVAEARQLAQMEMEAERRTAADLFRQAIRIDPGFALAHAGLADVLGQIARWRLAGWHETADEALASAQRAIELAPGLADAHLALGAALALLDRPGAMEAYGRALTLAPDKAHVHYRMARFLVYQGDKEGAVLHYERAHALAPDDYRFVVYALQEYQALGDKAGEERCLTRAASAIERHLERQPSDARALGHGAGVMALLGRRKDMQRMIDRAIRLRPKDYGNMNTLACAAMLAGDPEQALDLLERSVGSGQGDREWLLADNDLKPLHDHPRFQALLDRMV